MIFRVLMLVLVLLASNAIAEPDSVLPERRKPQFTYEPGYYVLPFPYSIPGVGEGIGAIGIYYNVGGSPTDLFAFGLGGELPGWGVGVSDVHIVPRTIILDLTTINFGQSTITSYKERGMQSGKHDFSYLTFSNYGFAGARLTATFADRRFEVYGGGYHIYSQLENIREPSGSVIIDVQGAPRWRTNVYAIGVRGDATDDYSDPRRGARLDVSRWWSPPASDSDPDYFRMEYSATIYFPLGKRSTWAFNAFRSDAHVTRKGETDPLKLQQQQGLDCGSLAGMQQIECNQVISNMVAANTYGSATSLGGTSRMRAYPNDRFIGAHTQAFGTEIRWTLTEEAHPFDIFIAKDVRTLLQVAAFYELGTAADIRSELGDIYRPSYGGGLRMVTASGIVFRVDLAFGREGTETTAIIGYPWESF